MGYMDKTLKQTVPYYSTMKRAGAFRQPQKPQKRQKRTTLTEYSQNGQKAVLKPHVTVNQAAKKLYDYEQTGLSPHEVANLVEQVQNLTRRVKFQSTLPSQGATANIHIKFLCDLLFSTLSSKNSFTLSRFPQTIT